MPSLRSSSIIWSVTIRFHSLSVVSFAVFSDKYHTSGFFRATSRSFHPWFFPRGVNTNHANHPFNFIIGRSKSQPRGSEIGNSENTSHTGFVPTILSIFLSVPMTWISEPLISSSFMLWSFLFLTSHLGICSINVTQSFVIPSQNIFLHCSYSGKIR